MLDGEVELDGELNEEQWQKAEVTGDFIIKFPNYGEKTRFDSYVQLFYDNEAIYVGGVLVDYEPDSVSYTLSQRDDAGNADWFGISFDPYATNVTSFAFIVTSAGVELDAIEFLSGPDFSWNAVWKSATKRRDDGWSFEMRIPFSAIRFPNKNVQNWNFNMARQVRRNREESYWNPVDPAVFGEITQSGKLVGIENIESPIRLSFTPYLTGYLENSYDESLDRQTWKQRLRGGMDLKYGLNDAFTLDLTMIPDFGQTTSDRQVLNLGPFEVRYNENRPFFIEGMDLFGAGGVFYTRRVGGTPYNQYAAYSELNAGEEVISNPDLAPLYNAAKLSGRMKNGLGLGVFNAIEGESFAIIQDSMGNERQVRTNPLTNYNVFVASQNLTQNSSVTFTNTNVMRSGSARDANVSVLGSSVYSKDRSHQINTSIKMSSLFGEAETIFGHAFNTSISKVSGNWGYTLSYDEISDTYDPNDLGFLYNNNSRNYGLRFRFNDYTPGKNLLRKWGGIGMSYGELYKPNRYSFFGFNWDVVGTTKNFIWTGFSGDVLPFGSLDHFESRTFGKEVVYGPSYRVHWFISTDYSKTFAWDMRTYVRDFTDSDQIEYGFNVEPRYRVSDRIMLILESSVDFLEKNFGYVRILDENYEGQIMLGVRDRVVVENTFRMDWIFTKRMGMDLRVRHYWQQVDYRYFDQLLDDGVTQRSDYNPLTEEGSSLHNTTYNAFTLDLNYRWVFMPGSELRIVYKNNIFDSKVMLEDSYFNTFETLFEQPQINSISLKFLIYVDAIYLRRKKV